jgi:hypothetical protein
MKTRVVARTPAILFVILFISRIVTIIQGVIPLLGFALIVCPALITILHGGQLCVASGKNK